MKQRLNVWKKCSIAVGLTVVLTMGMICPLNLGIPEVKAEIYGDYEYGEIADGTVEIMKYTGSATRVDIPEQIDGKKVTSIGNCVFAECTGLGIIKVEESNANYDCRGDCKVKNYQKFFKNKGNKSVSVKK